MRCNNLVYIVNIVQPKVFAPTTNCELFIHLPFPLFTVLLYSFALAYSKYPNASLSEKDALLRKVTVCEQLFYQAGRNDLIGLAQDFTWQAMRELHE